MNTVVASGTVIALVIYTGRDTRAVMNTNSPSTKVGLVDLEINSLTKALAFVTLLMSLTMVGLDGFRELWLVYTIRFLILFSSIIPIGLRVNLDMGKTFYSYLIMNDKKIPGTIVRTSTIPEELGRIEYLFSDKTGTLTKNEMELKKLHLGTISFGVDSMEDVVNHIRTGITELLEDQQSFTFARKKGITSRVLECVIALSVCHNVTPTWDENNLLSYQASSPDEIAIVKWTELMGLALVFRDLDTIKIRNSKFDMEFEILETFPFTSESKRMGIILRNKMTQKIIFYIKGADVVMSKLVGYNHWLDEECSNMAREGLRTLVIGRKNLTEDRYQDFLKEFNRAKISIDNRNTEMKNVISRYLEKDIELLGLTGVEDKLQDDVKLTFELLRNAGLRIWYLMIAHIMKDAHR